MTSINLYNNLSLVTLPSPSSTSCHCPDHGPPRELDKKFDKIFNLKNTSNNNPTNILNNLCTGLETFLGFNKDSKGYDGQGIVYSDLDRLCDGVMGFLYYLLKDVSEKQPYSVGKTMLKDFVETELKPKLSTGRKGFEVIEQVAGKVREYNESVKHSNDDVKNPVDVLLSFVSDTKSGKWFDRVHKIQVDNADEQAVNKAVQSVNSELADCKYHVDKFIIDTYNARNSIADLNSNCNNNVNRAKNNITHERKRLIELSDEEQRKYVVMAKHIGKIINSLRRSVNMVITSQVSDLVEQLKNM
ncbi:hypothetical protein, conserved, partial [Babesia bigemina]